MQADILAVGVHPDDIELSCSGYLLKEIANGKTVALLDLTYGELGTDVYKRQTDPEVNQDAIKLEVAPKVAVYTPEFDHTGARIQPWDDAVMLALTYAEIPYDKIYDEEVLNDKLTKYDWLHLHHEDFTGQYGRFYSGNHLSLIHI